MFNGRWRLRPAQELHGFWRNDGYPITPIFDLADGMVLATVNDYDTRTMYWITCHIEMSPDGENHRLADDPRDVPVYGTSPAHLLAAALDSGGDINHPETGELNQPVTFGGAGHRCAAPLRRRTAQAEATHLGT